MFPLIPILALFALVSGGVTLAWYDTLSASDKDKANDLANEYAARLFDKAVEELTATEARRVHALVQNRFRN